MFHIVSKLAKARDCLHAGSSASDLTLDPDEDSQVLVPRKSLKKTLLVTPPEKKSKGNGSPKEINTTPTEPVSTSASSKATTSKKTTPPAFPKLRSMKRQLSFSQAEGQEGDSRSDRTGTADQGGVNQPDTATNEGQKTPKRRAAKSKPGKKQKVGTGGSKTSNPKPASTTAACPKASKAPPPPPPPPQLQSKRSPF